MRLMLQDKKISELLRLPVVDQTPLERADPVVRSVWDSLGWWNHVRCGSGRDGVPTQFGTENNRRNIVISINADGFSPYRRSQHSITPIVAMILNLPESLRHQANNLILVGLIPGPKAPASYNPYMQMVVDELKKLFTIGFSIEDPTIGHSKVIVKVKLLYTCADYPAHGKLNCQQVHGATYGCHKCLVKVSSSN